MAVTSSAVSGIAKSTPDTSPTNTGWIWRTAIVIDASLSQPAYAPNRNRSCQPLEGQRPHVLGLDQALDGPRDPGRDKDLSAGGLTAQPCRQVRDGPDRAVVHATLEADGADRGVALGDADTQCELPAPLAPARGETAGHDQLGEVRREEALETPEPLELGDLLRDTPLQGLVELGELAPISSLLIVESLFLETSTDPSLEQHGVERLGEVVLGAEL